MSIGIVHLLKLCVGVTDVRDLEAWQERRRRETGLPFASHTTRMWPKRAEELLNGGSLYWVMRGEIAARQRILRLDRVTGDDGIQRCAIILNNDVVRVSVVTRRPFQGWRYLSADDAPRDLPTTDDGVHRLPECMANALMEIGVR